MKSLDEDLQEYRKQLEKGAIQRAYAGLMRFMRGLQAYLKNAHRDCHVSGISQGCMDGTYFTCTPRSLKQRRLKIAIVFLHPEFRFEVWLAGVNKSVQEDWWRWLKERGWHNYPLVPSTKEVFAIAENVLDANPDFSRQEALMKRIEKGARRFSKDILNVVSKRRTHE